MLTHSIASQTTKAFLPKMLELNQGHIVTVASSLGLFTTAGVEVCSPPRLVFDVQMHYDSLRKSLSDFTLTQFN